MDDVWHNESLGDFPPKKGPADGSQDIFCAASDTRPLNNKNTDNKTMAGCLNHMIRTLTSKQNVSVQRGFLYLRIFLQNVVDVDAVSRKLFRSVPRRFLKETPLDLAELATFCTREGWNLQKIPVSVFFDFRSAFCSVIRDFIFDVLAHCCCSEWHI